MNQRIKVATGAGIVALAIAGGFTASQLTTTPTCLSANTTLDVKYPVVTDWQSCARIKGCAQKLAVNVNAGDTLLWRNAGTSTRNMKPSTDVNPIPQPVYPLKPGMWIAYKWKAAGVYHLYSQTSTCLAVGTGKSILTVTVK